VTPAAIKAQFVAKGETVKAWAKAHDFPADAVYRVLNGYTPCRRGRMHEIAVKLGLKPAVPATGKTGRSTVGR
jgi:gp16 family phage-associated protein